MLFCSWLHIYGTKIMKCQDFNDTSDKNTDLTLIELIHIVIEKHRTERMTVNCNCLQNACWEKWLAETTVQHFIFIFYYYFFCFLFCFHFLCYFAEFNLIMIDKYHTSVFGMTSFHAFIWHVVITSSVFLFSCWC